MVTYPLVRPATGLRALAALARAGLLPPQPVLAVVDGTSRDWGDRSYHLKPICGGLGSNDRRITEVDPNTLARLDVPSSRHRSCDCRVEDGLDAWIQARSVAATALLAIEHLEHDRERTAAESLRDPGSSLADALGVARATHFGLTHPEHGNGSAEPTPLEPLTGEALAALDDAVGALTSVVGSDISQYSNLELTAQERQRRRFVVELSDFGFGDASLTGTHSSVRSAIGCHGLLGARAHGARGNLVALYAPAVALRWRGDQVVDLGPAPSRAERPESVFALYDAYQRMLGELRQRDRSLPHEDAAVLALGMVSTPG